MREWLKRQAVRLYALGMRGYKKYDELDPEKKKQIEIQRKLEEERLKKQKGAPGLKSSLETLTTTLGQLATKLKGVAGQ